MDSGLGNQMLDYAEWLAIRKSNPQEECYLENLIYELPNREGMFSMWNGYELQRIFGIELPNVRDLFTEEEWSRILKKIEDSRFWEENWNYAPYIVKAFEEEGLSLINLGKRPGYVSKADSPKARIRSMLTRFFRTAAGYHIKRMTRLFLTDKLVKKANEAYNVYQEYPSNSYVGHSFAFKYKGFGIERIEDEVREAFKFPPICDKKNLKILEMAQNSDSVAIHARRSDLLFLNGHCYEHGFFKRSVRYIKRKVENPVFFFFTDEKSVGWCEKNEKIFGIDFSKDKVIFVTWNTGRESYRDMQLMAECKHNIFTESTFGFWGAYLNRNPNKITCAPDCTILATHTF
jgi:Glycosyl transferase family 11.